MVRIVSPFGNLSNMSENNNISWDTYFFRLAELVATKSKDPSTKVGVVVVGPDHEIRSTGFNGFPRGVDETDPKRWERPTKYLFVEHAERNAIYNAARMGLSLKGCTMYMNFHPIPCIDCAKGVVQSGIKEVRGRFVDFSTNNDWHFEESIIVLDEGGVRVVYVDIEKN